MRRRSCDYFFKSCELGSKDPLERKRYEILNDYGVNMDTNKKQVFDFDIKIKRHKNSDCR